jgi:hypothetical protein
MMIRLNLFEKETRASDSAHPPQPTHPLREKPAVQWPREFILLGAGSILAKQAFAAARIRSL